MAKDMQKDTIVQAIHSVTLHPEGRNIPVHVKDIADVILVHSDGSQTPPWGGRLSGYWPH